MLVLACLPGEFVFPFGKYFACLGLCYARNRVKLEEEKSESVRYKPKWIMAWELSTNSSVAEAVSYTHLTLPTIVGV